jgi:hypothetical protein
MAHRGRPPCAMERQLQWARARTSTMPTENYLRVLARIESRLRKRASRWGTLNLDDPSTRCLLRRWDRLARRLTEEHPGAGRPLPFWEGVALWAASA